MAMLLLFSALLLLAPPMAMGEIDFNYPAVFNFGDSNTDTGGRVASGLESISPPYGETFFGRPSGRFCDGRLIIDFLLDAMDLPFSNSYLQSVGAPSFQTGTNFAAAGCSILPANPTSVSPFSFGIQIAQFLQFKSQVLQLLGGSTKYRKYIPNADSFSNGLYMFDIGQNDLAGAFYSKTEDQIIALIPTILLEFESGLKKLHDEGARKFWIHNTGPLGCITQNIAFFGKDPSKLDGMGCVAAHNRVARLFNLQLHALCTKLRHQFSDSNIIYVDIYTIKSDLISNYAKYGFEYPITTCCGYGGGRLNYDSRVPCGHTATLDGVGPVTAKGCNDTSEHVNWDGIHYTEAANYHVALRILTGKYSDPPFSDKMPFLLKPKY
ncbi:GDSL esterase/lipase [Rhynchospora pubera]|uniref:GDSL esterase/lipase n=1 Tax=Rhynchospora pubera TaxID=906938 RepID=A0AAV8EJD4_9POAL|nr:GDSL esterase/lipase [Rhynchospora pubera]